MLIAAIKTSQLGNRLQLFSHLIATAEDHKTGLVNVSFAEYAEFFETTSRDLFCRYPAKASLLKPTSFRRRAVRKVLDVGTKAARKVQSLPGVAYIRTGFKEDLCIRDVLRERRRGSAGGLVFIDGYFFKDFDAVRRHADKIRTFLAPARPYAERVTAFMGKVRTPGTTLVGVHIRHGDYKWYEGGRYFYELPAYHRIMARALDLLAPRPVHFLVCSDQKWTPADFPGLPVTIGPGHLIEDVFSLAECDYIVGPKSTFSQWASFYKERPRYVIKGPDHPFTLDDFAVCTVPA